MRPDGVRERMQAVVQAERAVVDSWSEYRMRVDLRVFIDATALLYYSDHSVVVALRGFRAVEAGLADPTQVRTGSDFEARCLAVVDELRPVIGPLAALGDDVRPVELDAVLPILLAVPPRVILGEDGPDRYFDLVCWNQANAVAEHAQRPYLAAARISREGFHHPVDRFDLVEPMTELRTRYEDEPEQRDEAGHEIVEMLEGFRVAAPWPRARK